MGECSLIELGIDDGAATVTLDRPAKANARCPDLLRAALAARLAGACGAVRA